MTDSTAPTSDQLVKRAYKKRGGQPGNSNAISHGARPGNRNAIKHGFYARTFSTSEIKRLDGEVLGEFKDEEDLIRNLVYRCAAAMKKDDLDVFGYADILRTTLLAVGRLESLHRTRKVIYEKQTSLDEALDALKYIPVDED